MVKHFFFFFFGCASRHAGSQFPDQGSNLCPLQWKHRVLTTGLPGNSRTHFQKFVKCFFCGIPFEPLAVYLFLTTYRNSLYSLYIYCMTNILFQFVACILNSFLFLILVTCAFFFFLDHCRQNFVNFMNIFQKSTSGFVHLLFKIFSYLQFFFFLLLFWVLF